VKRLTQMNWMLASIGYILAIGAMSVTTHRYS
jgi:hypothetical protein